MVLDLLLETVEVVADRGGQVIAAPLGGRKRERERLDLLTTELLDPVELLLPLRVRREVPRHVARSLRLRARPDAEHAPPRSGEASMPFGDSSIAADDVIHLGHGPAPVR